MAASPYHERQLNFALFFYSNYSQTPPPFLATNGTHNIVHFYCMDTVIAFVIHWRYVHTLKPYCISQTFLFVVSAFRLNQLQVVERDKRCVGDCVLCKHFHFSCVCTMPF